jgi:hypothetical protein
MSTYKLHPNNTHGHLGKGPTDWEVKQLGDTTEKRIHKVALDSISYRNRAKQSKNHASQAKFDQYIHKTGMEMLEMLPGETKEQADVASAIARKNARIGKVLRRRVRVSEMKDGGMSIAIDLEWDTTTWSTEEIQTGADALVLSFEQHPSMDRKRQAIRMISKLLERHQSAVDHLRKDIESVMNKCINRRLVHGKSAGSLDLLHVLDCCSSRYHAEYCLFNYTGRFCDLILLESKLAAVIIQTFFRAQYELRQKRQAGSTLVGVFAKGFGTSAEVYRQRLKTINARKQSLKFFWRVMHEDVTAEQKKMLFGVKGPVHINEEYITVGFRTMLFLCSSKTRKHAPDNREGIIKTGGLICLSSFLSATSGPHAVVVGRILAEVAKSPDCLAKVLHTGCVQALLRYIRHCRGKESFVCGALCTEELKVALAALARIAVHAAGIFRARGAYEYKVAERLDSRAVSYRGVIGQLGASLGETDVMRFLASQPLIVELIDIINECGDVLLLRKALQALFALACSEVAEVVIEEIISCGGRCMNRLVSLLDEEQGEGPLQDEDQLLAAAEDLGGPAAAPYCTSVASISLCVLLQLCSLRHGRHGLLTTGIIRMLRPFVASSDLCNSPSYHRTQLLFSALSRRGGGFDEGQGTEDWRAYDPEALEAKLHPLRSVDRYAYIDMLRSLRDAHPGIGAEEQSLDHVIGLLVLHSTSHAAALEFSTNSLRVGPKEICDFIVRPHDRNYLNTLSWELAAAGAVIIDALTSDSAAGSQILCPETINYLGMCLRVSYDELHAAKPKTAYFSSLLLNGVSAATEAASRLCYIARGDMPASQMIVAGMRDANAIVASKFFISFLGESQAHLSRHMFDLQDRAAFSSIMFMDELSALLGLGAGKGGKAADIEEELIELALNIGGTLCQVLKNLRDTFGGTTVRTAQILDVLCKLLSKLCTTSIGVDESIRAWKIFPALTAHFPSTLDGVNEFGTENVEFRSGLGMLPPSYYELLRNLCAAEAGRSAVLLDGFLRRALDTLRVIFSSLETERQQEENAYRRKCGQKVVPDKDERQLFAACVFLVSRMTNFNHPAAGSANDMILMEIFDLVPMLSKILSSKACSRRDIVFVASLELVSKLALDAVRTNLVFKINDVTGKIDEELQRSAEHSLAGAKSCVTYVLNVALGVRRADMRMNDLLPRMREGLVRTSRYHPGLSQIVADALYASVKYAGVEMKDVDKMMADLSTRLEHRDGEDDMSSTASGGVRLGSSHSAAAMTAKDLSADDKELCAMLPSEDILNELVFLSAQQERKKQLSRQMNDWLGSESENGSRGGSGAISRVDSRGGQREHLAQPGTYAICGISSCGTLHNTDSPHKHGSDDRLPYSMVSLHGNTSNSNTGGGGSTPGKPMSISETRKSKSISKMDSSFDSVHNPEIHQLELTKIHADKELQSMVLQRKQHYGFAHREGETGELPILTMKPCLAEDFGLGAHPDNRFVFDKPTDPESRRERARVREKEQALNASPARPGSGSARGVSFSPIAKGAGRTKGADGSLSNSKRRQQLNNSNSNSHSNSNSNSKSRGFGNSEFEVIAVDDLPELLLTRPPPPGKRPR